METTFEQGLTIRYIHLPNDISIVKRMDENDGERVAHGDAPHKIVDRKRKVDDQTMDKTN